MIFLPWLPNAEVILSHDHSWAFRVLKPFLQENITSKSGKPRINLILVRRLISCSHGFCHNSWRRDEGQVWQTPIPGSYLGLWKEWISWSQKWLTGPDSGSTSLRVVSEPKNVNIKEKPGTLQWYHNVATGPSPRTGTAWVKSQLLRPARPLRSSRKASPGHWSVPVLVKPPSGGIVVSWMGMYPPLTWRLQPMSEASLLETSPALLLWTQLCFHLLPPNISSHSWMLVVLGTEICLEAPKMLLSGD